MPLFATCYPGASKSSKSQPPKKQDEKSPEKKSSSSWLSGADSFWGSFAQNAGTSSLVQSKEKGIHDHETNSKPAPEKANDVPQKEAKLPPSKAMNLKRNNKKKSLKMKAEATERKPNDGKATMSTHENKTATNTEKMNDSKAQSGQIKKNKSSNLSSPKTDSISKAKLACLLLEDESGGGNLKASNDNGLINKPENLVKEKPESKGRMTKLGDPLEKIKDVSIADNVEVLPEKEGGKNAEFEEVELTKQSEVIAQVENLEPLECARNDEIEDKASEVINLQNKEINENESSAKFCMDGMNDVQVSENFLENKDGEFLRQQEQELVAESIQNLDLLSSAPIAASTPQRKDPFHHKTDGKGDNDGLSNLNELLKASESADNQNVKQEVVSGPLNDADKDFNDDDNEITKVKEDVKGLERNEEISDPVSKEVGKTSRNKVISSLILSILKYRCHRKFAPLGNLPPFSRGGNIPRILPPGGQNS